MIEVNTLGNIPFVLNAFLIEKIEALPDTTITLVSGKKFVVKENKDLVIKKAKDFYRSVYCLNLKEDSIDHGRKDNG